MQYRHFLSRLFAPVRRLAGCARGTAAVEFALLMPVVLLLIVGLYDFGMATYTAMSLAGAARAAGQYALQNPTDTAGIQQAADNASQLPTNGLTVTSGEVCQCPDGTTVSCTGVCPAGTIQVYVQVKAQQPFRMLISYPGLNNPMTLSGQAIFRLR